MKFFALILILIFFASCVLPPEEELNYKDGIDYTGESAIRNIYTDMQPGFQFYVLYYLEIIYKDYPDFKEGKEILAWSELLENRMDKAFKLWQESNDTHPDVIAGKVFYYAFNLDPDNVIIYGELLLGSTDGWVLGQKTLSEYNINYYSSSKINEDDILVLLAESYYIKANFSRSVELLLEVKPGLEIQPTDSNLETSLHPIISDMIEEYVFTF